MSTYDELLGAARALYDGIRRVAAAMSDEGKGCYSEDDVLALKTLHSKLRDVFHAALGVIPVLTTTYPPYIWIPREIEWAEHALAFLEANPGWTPDGAPPSSADWVHTRLWRRIEEVVLLAEASNDPNDWARVSREAVLFLEDDLRRRTGTSSEKRKQVALDAFKPDTGSFPLGKTENEKQSWQQFATGVLGAVGNPVVHALGEHSKTYAMGVVGAVSLLLTVLEEAYGPPV